jgi:hypothetical protein
MVDIHSMAASSHPSHQEHRSEGDATSCSQAGQTRRTGGRTTAMMVVATSPATPCQHTATTTVTLLTVVATKATLVAAHQLLNNPPPPRALPSAAEKWHHDIDQLVIAVINMPPHGGWQANCSGRRPKRSVAHS